MHKCSKVAKLTRRSQIPTYRAYPVFGNVQGENIGFILQDPDSMEL